MANKFTFEIQFDDKGSAKVVVGESNKVTKSLKKTSKAADTAKVNVGGYNKSLNHNQKMQKGVAQTGLSTAKGFSKQAQSINGGIVPAYAVLAANIFALTAAFNALRREAQIEDLAKGLQFVGNVAGQNLQEIAKGIKELTGSAVSMEEAMRTTAIGIAAGFRSDQMQELTKVAKGASIALGRDLGDALSRLTRGVAKLEPEILDELGILVRLDDAAQVYADRLGVAATSLSQFQRQQAFLNATLEQGKQKYGDLAEVLDTNEYDKLSASVADLAKNFLGLLNNGLKLGKIVRFLADNTLALAGVATILGAQITKSIAPGMFAMAAASAKAAEGMALTNQKLLENVDVSGALPKAYKNNIASIVAGSTSLKDYETNMTSLNYSMQTHEQQLRKMQVSNNVTNEQLDEKAVKMNHVRATQDNLTKAYKSNLTTAIQQNKAASLQAASQGHLITSFRLLNTATKAHALNATIGTVKTGLFATALKGLRTAAFWAVGGIKAIGAALFAFLPYIGIFISLGTALYAFIRDKWFPEDLIRKRVDEAIESFDNFANIAEQFENSSATGTTRVVNAYIIYAGVLDGIKGQLMEIAALEGKSKASQLREVGKRQVEALKKMAKARDEITRITEESFVAATTIAPYPGVVIEVAGTGSISNLLTAQEDLRTAALEYSAAGVEGSKIQVDSNKILIDSLVEVAEAGKQALIVQKALGGKDSAFNLIPDSEYAKFDKFIKDLEDGVFKDKKGVLNMAKVSAAFDLVQETSKTVKDSFMTMEAAKAKFSGTLNKLRNKERGPLDDLLAGAENIELKFKAIKELDLDSAGKAAFIKKLDKDINDLRLADQFLDGQAGLQGFIDYIENAQEKIKRLGKETKVLQVRAKQLAVVSRAVHGSIGVVIDARNAAVRKEIELQEANVSLLITGLNLSEDEEATNRKTTAAKKKIRELQEKITDSTKRNLFVERDNLKVQLLHNKALHEEAKLSLKLVENARTIDNIARGRGSRLTVGEEYKLAVETAKVAVEAAEATYALEILKADVAFRIMTWEFARIDGINVAEQKVLDMFSKQLAIQKQIAQTRIDVAKANVVSEGLVDQGSIPKGPLVDEVVTSALDIGTGNVEILRGNIAGLQEELRGLSNQLSFEEMYGGTGSAVWEQLTADIKNTELGIVQSQLAIKLAFLDTMSAAIQPFLASLRELGPDGAVAASIAEGSLAITASLQIIGTEGISLATKLAAAGSIIGQIMSMHKAKSDAVVAGIDREIAAEQKRDGKSAQSVAKLASLEKKKEKAAKKAFEVNKKMQMASTVINTAAAVVGALAYDPKGWWNIGIAAMIGVMGAAQLAIISGTSYQGGGSGSAPSGPSAISVGERSSSVDLAKSNSASGELSYLRGDRGTGDTGATNFVPTFTGRATGGNTALRVGEQGPELFIPDRPGVVLPADDTENMQSGQTNVNFHITAMDSRGIEEVLSSKRGYMINMFREAANANGEFFLEDINTEDFEN